MKLRAQNNTLRLCLRYEDIRVFKDEKKVSEEVHFGTATKPLIYNLSWERYAERSSVEYSENKILVIAPDLIAHNWVNSGQVGFNSDQDAGKGQTLNVLSEKDFKCLHK